MNGFQGNEASESVGSLGRTLPGQVVLVLQGGGALGSYQAGVYQALHEAGIEPDWIDRRHQCQSHCRQCASKPGVALAGVLEPGGAASDLEFSRRLSRHQRNAVLLVNDSEWDSRFLQTQSARSCRRRLSDRYR